MDGAPKKFTQNSLDFPDGKSAAKTPEEKCREICYSHVTALTPLTRAR